MSLRVSGALAVIGGLAWLLKVALMWANGGTESTTGIVGFLFLVGITCIAMAGSVRAWFFSPSAKVWRRILAILAFLVALVLMVDLPILAGWQIFGRVWIAEELGIILTAFLALGVGARWLVRGFGTKAAAAPEAVL
ncbi:hypothetical protein GCM10009849_18160 [Sinomonas flava]|uniref:Uncharacterized protein n=1 Tax=Sinomonas flava TaxID=496857 RepID=A0ABN3BSI4_9MICC